jgi:hypothetical protein
MPIIEPAWRRTWMAYGFQHTPQPLWVSGDAIRSAWHSRDFPKLYIRNNIWISSAPPVSMIFLFIASMRKSTYVEHVLNVLRRPRERNLRLDIDRCQWNKISRPSLIFIGFPWFYRRFIPGFSKRSNRLVECARGEQFLSKLGSRKADTLLARFDRIDPDKETWAKTVNRHFGLLLPQEYCHKFTTAPAVQYSSLK